MNPEQMRALADAPDVNHWSASARAALRAAADQLEAVQATIDIYRGDNDIEAHWLVGRLDVVLSTGGEAADHV